MTKKTKMILGGVAVLGLAYYLLNRGKGMKNMSGVSMSRFANMDGVRMSRFANMGGVEMSDFANAQGKRLCVHTNPDGSTNSYSPLNGSRCYRGDTLN
jgi:hypothetical protein